MSEMSLDSLLSSLISEGKKKITDEKRTSKLPSSSAPEYKPFVAPPQSWHISHLLCMHTNHICNICEDVLTHVDLFLMEIGPGAALRSTRDIPFGLEKKNIELRHDFRDEHIPFCSTCAMTQEPSTLLTHLVESQRPLSPAIPPIDFNSKGDAE